MARVKGPLFSMSASGQLGGAIVYSSWKGRPVVRELVIPANPNTAPQEATRAMMRFLSQSWGFLSGAQHLAWAARAASQAISPFNAFVQFNMNAWTQFARPIVVPGQPLGTNAVLATPTGFGGVGEANITVVVTTLNDGWGAVIAGLNGSTPVGLRNETKWVTEIDAAHQVLNVTIGGLAPGVWQFKVSGFTHGGNSGAYTAALSLTVS